MDTSRNAFDSDVAIGPVLDFIRADASARRFDDWGTSTVVDDELSVPLFERALFDQLHDAAGIDATFPVGNAGVIHVYGYWFSTVPTAYGLKRERWQQPDLARALGLSPKTFHLHGAKSRTPLQRLTDVARPLLHQPPSDATVVDAVIGAGRNSRQSPRLSRAVLVQAPGAPVPALVYGIAPAGDQEPTSLKLITVFPMQGDTAPTLKDFVHNPRPRWNATLGE